MEPDEFDPPELDDEDALDLAELGVSLPERRPTTD